MLAKAKRLSRSNFIVLKSTGHKIQTPLGSIVLKNGSGRYSIITSTKLSKKAVVRNSFRRRLYNLLPSIYHLDLIIYPSHKLLSIHHEELRTLVNKTLSSLPSINS